MQTCDRIRAEQARGCAVDGALLHWCSDGTGAEVALVQWRPWCSGSTDAVVALVQWRP